MRRSRVGGVGGANGRCFSSQSLVTDSMEVERLKLHCRGREHDQWEALRPGIPILITKEAGVKWSLRKGEIQM